MAKSAAKKAVSKSMASKTAVASKSVAKSKTKAAEKLSAKAPAKTKEKPKVLAKPSGKVNPKEVQTEAKVKAPAKAEVSLLKGSKKNLKLVVNEDPVVEDKQVVVATKEKKEKKLSKAELASLAASADDSKKWIELKNKVGGVKAPMYSMTEQFEAQTGINHKTLGWGFVISNNNDRLEVLFETGIKTLISNYKSNK